MNVAAMSLRAGRHAVEGAGGLGAVPG
jgi:hypothetical protein